MAFKFINSGGTGSFQTVYSRLVENPDTISLTDDTAGPLSSKSIPFDGVDDTLQVQSGITFDNISKSATNVAIDFWLKNSLTSANTRYTVADFSIIRNLDTTPTTGFDGIYSSNVVVSGAGGTKSHIEFRVSHNNVFDYALTSEGTITQGTSWHHVFCEFNSGAQTMSIWIDRLLDSSSTLTELATTFAGTGARIPFSTYSFGGRIDETRLWTVSGSASALGQIGAVTAIGKAPEAIAPALNEFTPSSSTLAAWWRYDSASAVQIIGNIADSIEDYTDYDHDASPVRFTGADIVSSETTIINGLSASGNLVNLLGGSTDHGGLLAIDPNDNTLKLESGSESLISVDNSNWTATGATTSVISEQYQIFYSNSAIKVNTPSADEGSFITIPSTHLLYTGNNYTAQFRLRSITGSTSARVNFILGNTRKSVTAVSTTDNWESINVTHKLTTGSSTGRLEVLTIGTASGGLFIIDGLQVIEGDHPSTFIGHGRLRKAGQLNWPVEG